MNNEAINPVLLKSLSIFFTNYLNFYESIVAQILDKKIKIEVLS